MRHSTHLNLLCLLLLTNFAASGQDCAITNPPTQFTVKLAWQSAQDGPSTVTSPIVANLNPQEDSIPEIIVLEGSFQQFDKVQIYRGDGSNAANPMILTVPGGFDFYPSPAPTVGDIDNDGIPELIISCADRRIRVFRNYTENPVAPMTLWITSTGLLDFEDQRPLLADFNADGFPEIYAGRDVFRFNLTNPANPTLNKILSGSATMGQSQYNLYNEGASNPTAVDILTPADCNGDPDCNGLELVAGPVIYSVDLSIADGDPMEIKVQRDLRNMVPANSGYRDGYTAVADVDLDGILDIIVTSVRQTNQFGMYVWNKNGLIRWFPYPTNTFSSGSLACIANVYDDTKQGFAEDYPEILICSSLNFTCYNLQKAALTPATPYWWNLPTSDGSGWTGSTVYDFNGDGISEIVYRDESNLRILYGGAAPFPPGVDAQRNWLQTPSFSITSDEYAVVADVDNDGETEIAVTGRINAAPPASFNARFRGRLRVYESDAFPWVPCRNVWNQYNYFIVNVNDDLSIPAQQSLHHLELPTAGSGIRPFNTYLSQRPLLDENFQPQIPLPDVLATVVQSSCQGDSMILSVEICNQGNKVFPTGAPIAFYLSNPTTSTASLMAPVQYTSAPVLADSCRIFQITLPRTGTGTQFGVVNDDASIAPPFQLDVDFPSSDLLECDFLNNLFQFEVPVPLAPVDLGPDVLACPDTSIQLNAGTGYAQYLWQDGSTSNSFIALQSGSYWVETTDFCGIKHVDTMMLGSYGAPLLQLDTLHGDCHGNPAQVQANTLGNFPPFTYQWSSGENSAGISTQTDGMYTVTVTNAKGCTTIDSIEANAGGLVEIAAQVSAGILCFGQTGSIGLNIQTGQAPFLYTWSDGSQTPQLNNVPAGTYTVIVSDASQCTDVATVILPQPDLLISNGISILPTCENSATGSLTFQGAIQGTPPYQLLWSNNASTNQIAQLPAGHYQITVTDGNGCSLTETAVVPEYAVPVASTVVQQVTCFGANNGSIAIQLTGGAPGYSYFWSNNATDSQIQTLSPGPYALTFTYANGICTQTQSFQITEPLPILTNIQQTPAACSGGLGGFVDLSVQNGIPPLQYLWSNNAVTQDLNNVGNGQYTVTLTDATGCTVTNSATLVEPNPLLSNGVAMIPACPGLATGIASFLGAAQGTPPYTLLWSNNVSTPTNPGLTSGSYQLTITDANGCTLQESLFVPEHTEPVLQAILQQVNCFNAQNGSINLSASGGTPGFGYLWSNNVTTEDLAQLGPGSYSLTLTYANGACSTTASYQITEPPVLVIDQATLSNLICHASADGAIDLNISGGTGAYSYVWSNNATTETLTGLSAGSYTVTITDANGCPLTNTFTLTQPIALELGTFTGLLTCAQPNVSIGVTANQSNLHYLWQSPGSILPDASSHTVSTAGAYLVTVTNGSGCTAQTQLFVQEDKALPIAEAGPSTMMIPCEETEVLLNATGSSQGPGFENRWIALENGTPIQDTLSLLLPVTHGGWFIHVVTNLQNGCQSSDSIQLNWNDPIQATYSVEPILCFGDDDGSIRFEQVSGGEAPYFYSIDNQTFTSTKIFQPLEPGTYPLRVRDGLGCSWEETVVLTEPAPLSVSLNASDTSLALGQSVQLIATTTPANVLLTSISWEPADSFAFASFSLKQMVAPKTGTEFLVQVTDQNGCSAEDRIWITVNNLQIYVPNVILPGSDDNGWFTIFAGNGVTEILTLQIYDRWGEQVFERRNFLTNEPTLGWDGSFRGQPQNPGVFVWYAEVLLLNDRLVTLKGDVTVLR